MLDSAKATTIPHAKTPTKYETNDHECWKDSPNTSCDTRTTPNTRKTSPVQMNAIDAKPHRIQRSAPRSGSMVSCLAYDTTRSKTSSCGEGEKPICPFVAANSANYSKSLRQHPKSRSQATCWIPRQTEAQCVPQRPIIALVGDSSAIQHEGEM